LSSDGDRGDRSRHTTPGVVSETCGVPGVRGVKTYIKAIVSILLIGVLLYNVRWETLLAYLDSLSGTAAAIVFLVFTVQFPISALKWKKALQIHGLDYPFAFLQKVLCIGFFFNNFLPTSIGGDAYRIVKTMPTEGFRSRAVSAVLVERIIGFAALLLLGFVGGIVTLLDEPLPIVIYYVSICIAGGVAMLVLYLLARTGMFSGLKARIRRIEKLEMLRHNVRLIRQNPAALVNIFTISLLFQALAVVAIGVLFEAMGADAGYAKYALIAAIVGLAAIIPLSINGIGVVEGAFAVSAIQLGMDYNQAVIVGFLLRILVVPLSLICGLIYILEDRFAARA